MELEKYKVELAPDLGIILVEHPFSSVSLDKLIEIKERIEDSTKRKYNYGIIKRSPGYYFSYELLSRKVIVCGRFNKKECVDETKEFATSNK
jgi:hypothetical protein